LKLLNEIIATYRKHGWQLRRVLAPAENLPEISELLSSGGENPTVEEAPVSALWFSRPSHEGREAWELRLVAETSYALFETFEPDEAEEDREELRREMEARLRAHVLGESA
jgi:hypothetical protein